MTDTELKDLKALLEMKNLFISVLQNQIEVMQKELNRYRKEETEREQIHNNRIDWYG